MNNTFYGIALVLLLGVLVPVSGCKKDNGTKNPVYPPRVVNYKVTGTNFRLNFIDSTGGFQRDGIYASEFDYTFRRAPGTSIGISIFTASPSDTIYSWTITIDGKLYANAFSPGGAYFSIPY